MARCVHIMRLMSAIPKRRLDAADLARTHLERLPSQILTLPPLPNTHDHAARDFKTESLVQFGDHDPVELEFVSGRFVRVWIFPV